jgi:phosphocarrier protein
LSDAAEGTFTIRSELGLHARPAGEFVALAGTFESEISVGRGGEWVDGRSVLSLLSLAASCGTELTVRAAGPDADAAVAALGAVLEAGAPPGAT